MFFYIFLLKFFFDSNFRKSLLSPECNLRLINFLLSFLFFVFFWVFFFFFLIFFFFVWLFFFFFWSVCVLLLHPQTVRSEGWWKALGRLWCWISSFQSQGLGHDPLAFCVLLLSIDLELTRGIYGSRMLKYTVSNSKVTFRKRTCSSLSFVPEF